MTTLTLYGTIDAPKTIPVGTYGYDNGAFFGSPGASLSGDFFTLVWTGTDCNCYNNPITDAVLTVNGISLDLGVLGTGMSEWLDRPGSETLQMGTNLPGSQYSLTTNLYPPDHFYDNGVFYLQDSAHEYSTQAFLTVFGTVPAPEVGTGIGALVALAIIAVFMWRMRNDQSRSSQQAS